jgi:hypothetical protein
MAEPVFFGVDGNTGGGPRVRGRCAMVMVRPTGAVAEV